MVLIELSVETPRSPSMAARSLAGPTSWRPDRHAEDTQQGLGGYVK
jgi:hypothetical protein